MKNIVSMGAFVHFLFVGYAQADDKLLSAMWVRTESGVVIQVSSADRLVMDAEVSPYILKGSRLVIRAAHVVLRDQVQILSFSPNDLPPKISDFDKAATKGPDGTDGGGNGHEGTGGSQGQAGNSGSPQGAITLNFGMVEGAGSLLINGSGQKGGPGQRGQTGGKGGTAGRGSDAVQGADCKQSGGNAGIPGDGGQGGLGGKGGTGGSGGHFRISKGVSDLATSYDNLAEVKPPGSGKIVIIYSGGEGGGPGAGGTGGDGGEGNDGGSGSLSCDGGHGSAKKPKRADQTQDLGVGDLGAKGSLMIIR